MRKQKDNLTDLIEKLPEAEVSENTKPSKNQQVLDNDGEVITLGYKNSNNSRSSMKGKSLELSRIKIKEIIREVMEEKLKDFPNKVIKAIEDKLKKQGFYK